MVELATGYKRAPLSERGHDLYETPAVAIQALMRAEKLPPVIWEPACGRGAIVQVLREGGYSVIAQDLVDYGCPDSRSGIDFLKETDAPAGVDAIVTNPPYKDAAKFVTKALELVPRVYMLLRLAFLEARRRTKILDGGHLARVHVFKDRLPMMHRDGWDGPRNDSAMAFAWFALGPEAPRRSRCPAPRDSKVRSLQGTVRRARRSFDLLARVPSRGLPEAPASRYG